jgi:hypothetical protein
VQCLLKQVAQRQQVLMHKIRQAQVVALLVLA